MYESIVESEWMHENFLQLMFILRFHFNTGRVLASVWANDKKPVESWEKIEKLSIGMSSQIPPKRFCSMQLVCEIMIKYK